MIKEARLNDAQIRIFENKAELINAAAAYFKRRADNEIQRNGIFKVALSGGSTPRPMYELLSRQPYAWEVGWRKTEFFWGDERMVPPDDAHSNYGMAWQLWLRHLGIDGRQIHRIKGELPLEDAIETYRSDLRWLADPGLAWPRFGLVLLGLGVDGHTASLVPGPISKREREAPVIGTLMGESQTSHPRVTLTPLVINCAARVLFLVSGAEKCEAVRGTLQGEADPERWPAQRIRPGTGELLWYLDEAAASSLEL
jgi:6-phosphogluconolactonase